MSGRALVLASTSPRRSDILRMAGYVFEQIDSGYEEDMTQKLSPENLVRTLALGKALSVVPRRPDAVIVGADTVIVSGSAVLGKPHTPERAREMLRRLSNKTHRVLTGHAVIDAVSGKRSTAVSEAEVAFRALSTEEIDAYIATGEPLDRAGAYHMHGGGAVFIRRLEGDYLGILGLSLPLLLPAFKKFGVTPHYRR